MRHSLLVFLTALLAACSDGPKANECSGDSCTSSPDAGGGPMVTKPAMRDGGPIPHNELTPDASSTELQGHLQVNGAHTQCGTCAVILAQAQGGQLPYSYEWSDPTLMGPGPHTVCPTEPTKYSVVITDSTPTTVGEFSTSAMQVEADNSVDCVADAGTSPDALLGCVGGSNGSSADAGANDAQVQCGDAAVTFDLANGAQGTVTVSTRNDKIFKAGQKYEYSQDRLIPLTITTGDAILVDVYGATSHCEPAQKLFTLTWDIFTWHQSFCFTPEHDFQYIIVAVHLNGALFSWELVSGGTLCSGCSDADLTSSP